MDFLEQIKKLDNDSLKKFIEARIKKLEEEKDKNEPNEIGYRVDSKTKQYETFTSDNQKLFEVDLVCFFAGYIKKGTKITYGFHYNQKGQATNAGNFYYMDDDEYLYEFCNFIKDKDVSDIYELFEYILDFLRSYFKIIGKISREDMYKLIYKDKESFYNPITKHSIKDFKGKGNALCTEYSVLAQNILSLFGIDSYLIMGEESVDSNNQEEHAFNIVTFTEEDDGKIEEVTALIDFSLPANVYDINYNILGVTPYIIYIDEFNQDYVDELIHNGKIISSEDYNYIIIGDYMINIAYDRMRNYSIISEIKDSEKVYKK